MNAERLGLFDAFGVELELMIVDTLTLDVRPICDQLLTAATGEITGEAEFGAISWSNELALHVVEFKVTEPVAELKHLAAQFQSNIQHANALLEPMQARLMPTAMHPWMNPHTEMRLWPHDYSPVYSAFDRIFNCAGHGWANLQSSHWNLPFANDAEFSQLHAAIRVLLPLLPVLTASSPIYDAASHGLLDCRLDVYRGNSQRIPSIAGQVVPEPIFSESDYDQQIFQRMYQDIAPLDPDGILQHVWLNARGAIARFDRGAIEIRVLDCQECPAADLALGQCIVLALQKLVSQQWSQWPEQAAAPTDRLAGLMWDCVRHGRAAEVPAAMASLFGIDRAATAGEVWQHIADQVCSDLAREDADFLSRVLQHGNLAERILSAWNRDRSREGLNKLYGRLCDCLANGTFFFNDPQAE